MYRHTREHDQQKDCILECVCLPYSLMYMVIYVELYGRHTRQDLRLIAKKNELRRGRFPRPGAVLNDATDDVCLVRLDEASPASDTTGQERSLPCFD
jgi:hypothetical protein